MSVNDRYNWLRARHRNLFQCCCSKAGQLEAVVLRRFIEAINLVNIPLYPDSGMFIGLAESNSRVYLLIRRIAQRKQMSEE